MNTLPNDINSLKIMLHTNHLAKIVEGRSSLDLLESLRKKHKEDIDILENQLVSSHAGISRRNITSLKWHCMKENSEMANHFLGFSDFNEFIIYVKAFWPDSVSEETMEDTICLGEQALSKFEKLIMAKMLLTRNFSNLSLAAIFGVTSARVTQILDEYVPMWVKIGLLLSI